MIFIQRLVIARYSLQVGPSVQTASIIFCILDLSIITTRNSSCWKVMFSQVAVYPQGGGYPRSNVRRVYPPPQPHVSSKGAHPSGHGTWDTHTLSPEHGTCDTLPLPVLTPSGGHCNTYGCQVGGTHSTRMLSC